MHNAPFFIKYKLHHVIFWLLVFGIWFFFRVDDYSSEQKAFIVTLIKVVDLIIMISVTNYLLIPRLLYRKRYFLFAICLLTLVIVSSIIKMNIIGRVLNSSPLYNWSQDIKARVYDNVIPHLFLVIAGAAIKLMFDYGKLQQRMAETAREKAEAELSFLKSQINPHFLFNSLNSVYFLIDKSNTAARETLHKFSEMLRYQLYEANGDKIPVEKEIQYLKDYMDLQQLRKDEKYAVSFSCAPSVRGFNIEPLLLVSFVENAFKHISHHSDKTNFVRVDMQYENSTLIFSVENSKEKQPSIDRPGGIGLSNVRRRLELLYPGKHDLVISNQDDLFTVHLNIRLS